MSAPSIDAASAYASLAGLELEIERCALEPRSLEPLASAADPASAARR
jgi:hypothetical protein